MKCVVLRQDPPAAVLRVLPGPDARKPGEPAGPGSPAPRRRSALLADDAGHHVWRTAIRRRRSGTPVKAQSEPA